jgi:hypothetical protein
MIGGRRRFPSGSAAPTALCAITSAAWITQWDVLRLQGRATRTEEETVPSNYAETADLDETPAPAEDES